MATVTGQAADPSRELQAQVGEMLAAAGVEEEPVLKVQEEPASAPAHGAAHRDAGAADLTWAPGSEGELAEAVDRLLDETAVPAGAAEGRPGLQSLDEELARSAGAVAQAEAGEDADLAPAARPGTGPEQAGSKPAAGTGRSAGAPGSVIGACAGGEGVPAPPDDQTPPGPAASGESVTTRSEASGAPGLATTPVPAPVEPALVGPAATTVGGAPGVLWRLAELSASPLRSRPRHVADTVAWFALWTAFLGACVWVYVLFGRSPEMSEPGLDVRARASATGATGPGRGH